jgi:hypothetical protein
MLITFNLLTAHVSEFHLGCKILANFKRIRRKFGQLQRLYSSSFPSRVAENTYLFGGLSDTDGKPDDILLHQDCKYYHKKCLLKQLPVFKQQDCLGTDIFQLKNHIWSHLAAGNLRYISSFCSVSLVFITTDCEKE